MLVLHSFRPVLGTISPSPFTVKAEALLRMAGLDYSKEFPDVRKAPRGKFPVLVDNGEVIADSGHIQRHLETRHGVDFDSHLTAQQRATATAYRRLIEHHFYFLNGYFRWADFPDAVRDSYFAEVPSFLRGFVFRAVNKKIMSAMHAQGLGRHTREQMERFAAEDVEALATELADRPFLLGEKASSIDASLFGALDGLVPTTIETVSSRMVKEHANLVDYHTRLRALWFPEV